MLRIGAARQLARYTAFSVGGITVAGGTTVAIYLNTPNGAGLKRELHFWNVLSPVIFDYWWNAASSSPNVKFQKWIEKVDQVQQKGDDQRENSDDAIINEHRKSRKELLKELHNRNAPRVFQVMLTLGGLYVKLGQVLSVSALPIPDEYRDQFRTLQSNVPGHEEFESVVKPTLEKEFRKPLDDIFESFEEIPCGAASIGQAHKARLKDSGEDVVVKVQYPGAKWQVPADIHCVGDFLNICVWFGIVDEFSARLSYDEFARQFMTELDYENERTNLEQVYKSSLNPDAPYIQRGVIIPHVYPELCTKQVVTMKFLPGPKFEEEAKRQLTQLGFDTKQDVRSVVRKSMKRVEEPHDASEIASLADGATEHTSSLASKLPRLVSQIIGVDSLFFIVKIARRLLFWSTSATAATVRVASYLSIAPGSWRSWAAAYAQSSQLNIRLNWTEEAIQALLDVHGYQILDQGLFNADPHPGNILVVLDGKKKDKPKIGLIDYGQCKRLSPAEQARIARLILSVAEDASDETVADNFRSLGIRTKNDSTKFLAAFARLMFGSFKPEHLDHSWHRALHEEDRVIYFPNELSMVYRTSLLLRGLAMSLQQNISVGKLWRHHAKTALRRYENNARDTKLKF